MQLDHLRNFCIIAHVDHGKSTLADRLLLRTGVVTERQFRNQLLDSMDLERERGITIKASAVQIPHDGLTLNLIDTPGHVDFNYEVSRSLHACEGALLLVDAAQGVEAQTVANCYLAIEADLEIVPVLNKVDLPGARPDEVIEQIEGLGLDVDSVLRTSAKTGEGVDDILRAIVERIPPPEGEPHGPTRALIYDASYDDYRGIIVYVRVFDGSLRKGDRIQFLSNKSEYEITEVGSFSPKMQARDRIEAGSVGYVVANLKTLEHVKIGDTIAPAKNETVIAIPASRTRSRSFSAASTRPRRRISTNCAKRSRSSPSTTRLSRSTRNRARHSASVFAAAFWACSTWRSSRKGSSAKAAPRSSRRRRTSPTRSSRTMAP